MNNISTHTTSTFTTAHFSAGDRVLCPSLSPEPFELLAYPEGLPKDFTGYQLVSVRHQGKLYQFQRDGRQLMIDMMPALYHDTKANRHAIALLFYGGQLPEVIAMDVQQIEQMSFTLSGAIEACGDSAHAMNLIASGEVQAYVMHRWHV